MAVVARAPVPLADSIEAAWAILADVPDPEIPVLSVVDLGIVRYVRWGETERVPARAVSAPSHTPAPVPGGELRVGLTPTYSGCPATDVIRQSVQEALVRAGYENVVIENVLSPPWSSDWITDAGRRKLKAFGIAPPAESVSSPRRLLSPLVIACPRCGSRQTERVSEFGSTPCKAHYRCVACLEPFDYFKCI